MPANDGIERLRASGLDGTDAQRIYRFMLLARAISVKSWLLTRQGRVLFTMPCDGQEAADVASAYALDRGIDFIVPYARSLGAMLVKGMTTLEVMLNMFGKAADPNGGGGGAGLQTQAGERRDHGLFRRRFGQRRRFS